MSDFLSRVESILSGVMNFNPKSRVEKLLMKWVGSVGNVEDLETEDKSSVVAAINEIAESGGGGGLPEAPKDGETYGRKDGSWNNLSNIYAQKSDLNDLQPKTIADTAGYFTTDTVEDALAEIGGTLDGLEDAINTIRGVS